MRATVLGSLLLTLAVGCGGNVDEAGITPPPAPDAGQPDTGAQPQPQPQAEPPADAARPATPDAGQPAADAQPAPAVPLTFTLVPAELTFPELTVGQVSPPQSITITNTSAADAPDFWVYLNGAAFSIVTNDCPTTLPAHASCAVSLTFSPLGEQEAAGYVYASLGKRQTDYGAHLSGIGHAVKPDGGMMSPDAETVYPSCDYPYPTNRPSVCPWLMQGRTGYECVLCLANATTPECHPTDTPMVLCVHSCDECPPPK